MTNKTRLLSDVNSGPSPAIFKDLGKLRDDADLGNCMFFDDDFTVPGRYVSNTVEQGYLTYQDTNVTITGKAVNDTDIELGVLDIDVLDTDNDEGSIQFGSTNQWRLGSVNNTSVVGYEVRLRVDELAANETCIAVGMTEGIVDTALSVDDTAAVKASVSYIGFRSLVADPVNLDVVYQNTATAGVTTLQANAAALVENTYTKLGFLYDPTVLDVTKRMRFFQDGVEVAAANATQIAGANFPLNEGMVPFVLGKTFGSGTSGTVSIDRVTGFMYRNGVQGP